MYLLIFDYTISVYTDINECLEAVFMEVEVCPINTECTNTPGSFECPCVPGFSKVNESCIRKFLVKTKIT